LRQNKVKYNNRTSYKTCTSLHNAAQIDHYANEAARIAQVL